MSKKYIYAYIEYEKAEENSYSRKVKFMMFLPHFTKEILDGMFKPKFFHFDSARASFDLDNEEDLKNINDGKIDMEFDEFDIPKLVSSDGKYVVFRKENYKFLGENMTIDALYATDFIGEIEDFDLETFYFFPEDCFNEFTRKPIKPSYTIPHLDENGKEKDYPIPKQPTFPTGIGVGMFKIKDGKMIPLDNVDLPFDINDPDALKDILPESILRMMGILGDNDEEDNDEDEDTNED